MGVSYEGAGLFYRYIVCPLGILCFFISLFGGFDENSGVMMIVGIVAAIFGYFGPKYFSL